MAFPRRLLNEDEEIVLDLNPHWIHFAEPVLALAGALLFTLVVHVRWSPHEVVTIFCAVLIVALAGWLAVRYVKWVTTSFVITNDRMIFRNGIFAKSGIEIPIERVNNVIFRQTVFERLVGAGDLVIESGSENGQQRFSDINHPELVQNEIHNQINANENRQFDRMRGSMAGAGAPLPPPTPAPDVPAQIERLAELAAKGAITPAEFEAKRTELLKRL